VRLSPGAEGPAAFAAVDRVFDAHLSHTSAAPIAVAYSGGGDSLALLLAAQAWSAARGRRLIVLHVDHGLQATSGAWAAHCREVARRLDLSFEILTWTGPKPATGRPAAARAARHSLLADAARAAGAAVVLMGHTADDVLEARQMRRDGATTPDPRPWGPSPAWPEGRGVFLLRPLLAMRRAELRQALAQQTLTWIEDPANSDPAYARARARAVLGCGVEEAIAPQAPDEDLTALARRARHGVGGTIGWRREDLDGASAAALAQALSIASLCVAGGARPPRRASAERLADAVRSGRPFTATLAGARLVAGPREVIMARESGEAARGGLVETPLLAGEPLVWDGRFEVLAEAPGFRVAPLAGRMTQLAPEARRAVTALPAAARKALPVLIAADETVTLETPEVEVRSLTQARFEAATGQVGREPDAA
jgi:tRNA(Ile)-lysidine synthase|tara:strand:+ start:21836 stop:23113 length:1278 start_codon:yes stop_codon:yes gene_type:complete